jgi:hypothetical protein
VGWSVLDLNNWVGHPGRLRSSEVSRASAGLSCPTYFQNHAGVGYTVAFSFAHTESLAHCETVADSIFATWTWT